TLNAAATARPDALLVTPTDPNGMIAPLRSVKNNDGIPIVTVVNELAKTDGINAEVTVDNEGAGRNGAKTLAKAANGKKVTIASFGFTKGGSMASDGEIKGFEAEIRKYPNITYLGAQYVSSDTAASTTAMNAMLARQPDLFGVYAAFGESSDGILASLRQRNADVKLVAGWAAANDPTVKGMRDGEVLAINDFPFREVGKGVLDTAAQIVKGDPVHSSFKYPSVTYTKASFDDPNQAQELGAHKCPA
ncbi:MAG: substrate-binding domain-containing protein, partial [Mycobacterium sp.]|nr:substrate-binding domain-containing protein [Mycobacterium sp.]